MSDKYNILITGASQGFGRDAAQALAAQGHTIFATMRGVDGKNKEAAGSLQDWAKSGGHAVHVLELDVTNDASVKAAVAAAIDKGGIDVLVNNAGVGTWGVAESYSADQVQRIFNVNLFGIVRMNNAVLPHLREKGKGLIVYLSSGLGRLVIPFLGPYTASKFAVEAYAENSSYELAALGIETSIVQPGAYGTGFMMNALQPGSPELLGSYGATKDAFEAFSKGFEERAKAGEMGNPDEIRDALVEVINAPAGKRPLRKCVGADVAEGVGAINGVCEQVQDGMLKAFGFRQ